MPLQLLVEGVVGCDAVPPVVADEYGPVFNGDLCDKMTMLSAVVSCIRKLTTWMHASDRNDVDGTRVEETEKMEEEEEEEEEQESV